MALGYFPCALFSFLLFGIPLPIEIVGNRFSNVSYIHPSGLIETFSLVPLIFAGLSKNTLGMISYSPILASIIIPSLKMVRSRDFSPNQFEKFLLIFAFACFLIYLPYLKNGVVETGVRDYRFYLPLYLPLMYFIAKKIKPKVEVNSLLIVSSCIIATTIFAVSLFSQYFDEIKITYMAVSSLVAFFFLFIDRFENKKDLFALAFLPLVFLISDIAIAYFSPYDIHFTNPLLDRFLELLIWLKSLNLQ